MTDGKDEKQKGLEDEVLLNPTPETTHLGDPASLEETRLIIPKYSSRMESLRGDGNPIYLIVASHLRRKIFPHQGSFHPVLDEISPLPLSNPLDPSNYIDRPVDSFEAYQALRAELEMQGYQFQGNYWTDREPDCGTCRDDVAHCKHFAEMRQIETIATPAFTTDGQPIKNAVGLFERAKQ